MRTISQDELSEFQADKNTIIVDVREADEHAAGAIVGSVHVPLSQIRNFELSALPDKEKTIVCYCGGGKRSVLASQFLEQAGYEDVCSLTGGYTAWKRRHEK